MIVVALDQAFVAARNLTREQQEALAKEILDRVAELDQSHMTPDQRAIVKERLQQPARYASAEDVRGFFAKHGVHRTL